MKIKNHPHRLLIINNTKVANPSQAVEIHDAEPEEILIKTEPDSPVKPPLSVGDPNNNRNLQNGNGSTASAANALQPTFVKSKPRSLDQILPRLQQQQAVTLKASPVVRGGTISFSNFSQSFGSEKENSPSPSSVGPLNLTSTEDQALNLSTAGNNVSANDHYKKTMHEVEQTLLQLKNPVMPKPMPVHNVAPPSVAALPVTKPHQAASQSVPTISFGATQSDQSEAAKHHAAIFAMISQQPDPVRLAQMAEFLKLPVPKLPVPDSDVQTASASKSKASDEIEAASKRRRVSLLGSYEETPFVDEDGHISDASSAASSSKLDLNQIIEGGVKCDECGFLSPNRGELHKHMRKHTPDKPYICPVEGCDFRTRYPGNIKHHLPSHKNDRPYACSQCDLTFKTKSQLTTHMLVHNSTKPFECEECGFRCKRRWELKMHKLSHSDERNFKCDTCGHATKTMSDLVKHQAKHVTERNFKCDQCDKSYKDNRALRKHIRYTHTDTPPVSCTVCDKVFRNKINLRNHMRLHEGHYPFKCDVCDMRFANNHNKRVHEEVHKGDRPFKCPVCPYAGKQELDVRAHIGVMHKNERLYRCGICDIGFAKERGLIQHFGTDKHKYKVKRAAELGLNIEDAIQNGVDADGRLVLASQGATLTLSSNGNIVLDGDASGVKDELISDDEGEFPAVLKEPKLPKLSGSKDKIIKNIPRSTGVAAKISNDLLKVASAVVEQELDTKNMMSFTALPPQDSAHNNPYTILINQTPAGNVVHVSSRQSLGAMVQVNKDEYNNNDLVDNNNEKFVVNGVSQNENDEPQDLSFKAELLKAVLPAE